MMKHLSAGEKAKVKELQDRLRPLNQTAMSQSDQELRDKLLAELDAVIAAECPLCNDSIYQSTVHLKGRRRGSKSMEHLIVCVHTNNSLLKIFNKSDC